MEQIISFEPSGSTGSRQEGVARTGGHCVTRCQDGRRDRRDAQWERLSEVSATWSSIHTLFSGVVVIQNLGQSG